MTALLLLIHTVLDLFKWVLIVSIVMSWLLAFGVVNRYNRVVDVVYNFVTTITEPVLRPIRNVLPSMGGLDLSPLIVFLGIIFLQNFLLYDLAGLTSR